MATLSVMSATGSVRRVIVRRNLRTAERDIEASKSKGGELKSCCQSGSRSARLAASRSRGPSELVMSESSSAYLTLSQVAARTGRHPELLRQWCAAGRIPCQRLGGSWVVLEADLELLDTMATRARRRTAVLPAPTGRQRLIAAVFDDGERAGLAAQTLTARLRLDADAVETAPIGIESL